MMQKEILHYFIVNSGLAKFEWKKNMEKNFPFQFWGGGGSAGRYQPALS